ncbi:hypothetical protein [Cellulosimicrobium sp. JZ28]|uniref:hypothetical protein n=1 Tax=Cellulosimicrobium sp. JZ28 TaxID=1906273 RepID=UPI00188A067B|nr:hypothetical protein [Cellulosimicrobium sp. JZ28]
MDPFPIEVVIAPNDPNVWDILTAIGTVGAVVVAIALGWVEGRRRNRAQKQELMRLEQDRVDAVAERLAADAARDRAEGREALLRHQAQARRVAIWRQDEASWAPEIPGTQAVVGNFSDEPIFNISTRVVNADDSEMFGRTWYRLLPGQQGFVFDTSRFETHDLWKMEIQDASVRFRDMAGQEWIRYLDGRLDEIEAPDDPYTCTLQ